MRKYFYYISIFLFIPLFFFLTVFCINQIELFSSFFETIIPGSAFYIKITALFMFFSANIMFFYMIFSIPVKPDFKILDKNIDDIINHIRKNKLIKNREVNSHNLKECIEYLDETCIIEIKKISTSVFLSTALSQWGKIDGVIILIQQIRLVWKIIFIYNSRPSLSDIISIYSNVMISSIISFSVEEADIVHYLEPIINESFENTATSIPVIGNIAQIIVSSIFSGTTNAALTVRTGLIAQDMSNPYREYIEKKKMLLRVSKITGSIVYEKSRVIITSAYKKGISSFGKVFSSIIEKVKPK